MMYLSVPIPELTTMVVEVRFIPWDKSQQHVEVTTSMVFVSIALASLLLFL
jgi:hypothetical protein